MSQIIRMPTVKVPHFELDAALERKLNSKSALEALEEGIAKVDSASRACSRRIAKIRRRSLKRGR